MVILGGGGRVVYGGFSGTTMDADKYKVDSQKRPPGLSKQRIGHKPITDQPIRFGSRRCSDGSQGKKPASTSTNSESSSSAKLVSLLIA